MTPDQIVAFVLALAGPPAADPLLPLIVPGGADPRYPVVAVACPGPVAPEEVEGMTVACGRVNLPEDHDKPDGRRIDLTFMVLKSHSLAPAADPVVYLHGGPGSGVVRNPILITRFLEEIRDRRDIIAFDQRGVDTSAGPESRCYATVANPETLADAILASGSEAEMIARGRQAVRACLDEIAANGADISTVNTLQNARDVQALMRALGHGSYNIFGTSYGTFLAQEVMRSAPEGLRSVVVDSVWPVQVPMYDLMGLPLAENVRSLFQLCAADAACAAAYPDLEARFWALWAKLEAAPLRGAQGPITGRSLFMLLIGRNSFAPGNQGITGYLPKMIAELEQGVTVTHDEIAAKRLGSGAAPAPDLSGLDATSQALAETALNLAEIGRATEEAVSTTLAQLEVARNRAAKGTDLVEVFDTALADAAKALPTLPARIAFGSDYLMLRASTPTTGALDALMEKHFTGTTLVGLRALSERMTDAQLAQVFDRISRDNSAIDDVLVGQFQLQMFACQENMDINGPETIPIASARLRDEFGWPESMIAEIESGMNASIYGPCEEFQRVSRPGIHDPVTADIPTLVLQGTLDTQTAPSWGPMLASTLPKAQLAILPEAGHGTFIFSDCSRDIAASFLDTPEALVNTSCTASLMPGFLLPDGSWTR
ncbi:alpha/beta hydrolase [Neotabrizicola shimadae]|uniref:Alpha/beta fold hydrolase n=1 Tax=Neotabrizicola shimadae TaxID=2807096 RepID=A0A8G1EC19_9RHOB|nr:alpha/beta fold hydrolase [Neotabrizicola shimadae]QYZ69987.1 alpha/beta fold hydrolase [Neotabrizicola shimadae]